MASVTICVDRTHNRLSLISNQQVEGSSPFPASIKIKGYTRDCSPFFYKITVVLSTHFESSTALIFLKRSLGMIGFAIKDD